MKKILSIAAFLAIVAASAVLTSTQSNRPQPPPANRGQLVAADVIPSPDFYVPFDADIKQTQDGWPDVTGRVYRDSNGSTRLEQNDGGSLSTVTITDNRNGKQYEKIDTVYEGRGTNGAWTMIDIAGRPPMKLTRKTSGFRDPKRRVEAFDVVEVALPNGDRGGAWSAMAPGLNFFVVERRAPADFNLHRRLLNIQIREQDPALFLPPQGAKLIEKHSTKH